MKTVIKTDELKVLVSGLRRELKKFGEGLPSHNQMLELVAKSLGHSNVASLLASSAREPHQAESPAFEKKWNYFGEERDTQNNKIFEGYRLFNDDGALDVSVKGESASRMVTGFTWTEMNGTADTVPGVAWASEVKRVGSRLVTEFEGSTEMDWNGQTTLVDLRGKNLWVAEDGSYYPEDACVAVAESLQGSRCLLDSALENHPGLTMRQSLLDSVFLFLKDRGLATNALSELNSPEWKEHLRSIDAENGIAIGYAQYAAGFALHLGEVIELKKLLTA